MPSLLAMTDPSKMLTGFDFRFMPKQSIGPAIDALHGYKGFGGADRAAAFRNNAASFYPKLA